MGGVPASIAAATSATTSVAATVARTAIAAGTDSIMVGSVKYDKIDPGVHAVFSRKIVTELLREEFPGEDPLARGWLITAARINLYYPPANGKKARVVSVEVTSRGRLNLHQFDDKLRQQLEGYLVEAGILRPDQTLTMEEVDLRERPDLGLQLNDLAEVEE